MMASANFNSDGHHNAQYAAAGSSSSPATPLFGFRLSFTQGFLAGQLSVVVIALLAIRFIIFEDSRAPPATQQRRPSSLPLRTSKNRKSKVGSSSNDAVLSGGKLAEDADVTRIMTDILAKVDYELDSHVGESIDWVNVIFAQALAGYRQDIATGGWSSPEKEAQTGSKGQTKEQSSELQRTARDWMEEILNVNTIGRGMSFLDPIQVTHVEFGDSYPILSNAKVRPADDMGRMRIEVDIDYSDCISLAIETKLLINLPRPRFAVLPISLGLSIERFSGTLAIELFSNSASNVLPGSNTSNARSRHEVRISLHPDFALDASATSLVGSRAKLQDLPKIEQLLVGRVRSYIHDRFVWPKYWTLTLPNLVPRHVRRAHDESVNGNDGHSKQDAAEERGQNGYGDGLMHVEGPGDALNELHADHQNAVFFETAPPLFPGVLSHQHPDLSLPGTLPTVEAWRSHAAAHGSGASAANVSGTGGVKVLKLSERTEYDRDDALRRRVDRSTSRDPSSTGVSASLHAARMQGERFRT